MKYFIVGGDSGYVCWDKFSFVMLLMKPGVFLVVVLASLWSNRV